MVASSDLKPGVRKVAMLGNPNTGKSTLFNALTGMQVRVGNYPGVTVEKKVGRMQYQDQSIELIDLPGTYSLSPRTLDEMVTVDVLLGRQADVGTVDGVVCIVDASNLERNLYLVSQVLDMGLPTVVVLNMWDVAQTRQVSIDVEGLRQRLGIPVIVCEAHRRMGVDDVRRTIAMFHMLSAAKPPKPFPAEFYNECSLLSAKLAALGESDLPFYLVERLLIDAGGSIEKSLTDKYPSPVPAPSGASEAASVPESLSQFLVASRERLKAANCKVPMVEAKARYGWVRQLLAGVATIPKSRVKTRSDRIDKLLTHRFAGLAIFALIMFLVFQAIYSWSEPLMKVIEAAQKFVSDQVAASIEPGPLRSLIIDGAIAGVGGVLVFLPQIALLFFFIAILEDCGYMARASFVMDKLMTKIGLSGKSFLPLMSSFACAVPGIMATRVIENRRDRMVTILIAPLMSCSARVPVYVLMTTTFVPPVIFFDQVFFEGSFFERHLGIGLQGLTLFGMTSLGAMLAVPIAWLLKKFAFPGETPPFVMELPSYKWPSPRVVVDRVYDRVKSFINRAGTLIFATTVVIWAAGYFPGDHTELHRLEGQIAQTEAEVAKLSEANAPEAADAQSRLAAMMSRRNRMSGELVEQSILGRTGHVIEPIVRPLGWDWKIGVGVLASFPAREVIVATLGTIYSLGGEVDENDEGLKSQLLDAKHSDGVTPVFNVVVAMSVMVFFALCAQCSSTLMVIRRETNSWKWAAFTFCYMTGLAYVASLLTYQVGMLMLS